VPLAKPSRRPDPGQALTDIRRLYIRLSLGKLKLPTKTNGRKFGLSLEIGLSDRN
jgi:hypothetical protein